MTHLWQDLRYGARMLWKRPGFTLVALLSLSLGIGANTAIFSLVNALFLRSLPVAEPQRIVALNNAALDGSRDFPTFSVPNYRDLRDRNDVLAGMLAYRNTTVSLSRDGVNSRVWSYLVTGNYFELLGVQPLLGRFFTPQDDLMPGAHPVAVITHECWQTRFGSDAAIVGKQALINGHSFTIIGVAAPGFYGTEVSFKVEMWFPSMMLTIIEPGRDYLNDRDTANFFVQGRLKPGVTLSRAEAALKNIAAQLAREYPADNEGLTIALSPPGLFGTFMRGPLMGFAGVLTVVVGLVLLLACTNLANLLLARATERRKEIAVRLALGASRTRLVRQLLTESMMLSILGGGSGLLLASWLIDAVAAFKPPLAIPLMIALRLDQGVLLFTCLLTLLTGLLFGLLPAWQATNSDLVPALKDETKMQGYRRSWLRNSLVVGQVALSLVLLICAGLVLRGLQNAQRINPGFIAQHAVEMTFDLKRQGYDEGRIRQFKQQLLHRVRALPGIEAAGLTDFVPLSLDLNNEAIQIEGQPEAQGAEAPMAMTGMASPGTLAALGTRLVQGRDFTEQDGENQQRVALVNETFARRFWPEQSALGRRFSLDGTRGPWIEVVGIIQDGKYFSLSEETKPFAYFNMRPRDGYATLIARTNRDPATTMAALRREFQQLDATLPIYSAKTLTEHMAAPLFPARVAATLLGSFGLLALLLAAIGIFGVMSYAVAQRTRELGIRIALGANTSNILRLVLGQGIVLTALGLALGLAAALIGTRWLGGLLFGLNALDLTTFTGVALLLAAVAVLACWIPARRATKVDPMVALRWD
ncbi:MAG: ABC transporter permease [Blastocatellia bacterium]|nr:ABC transporter permease [Blastocatellia bacterium]